ncbi:MurR/RpiR family transcriptional regulator [Streptomyces sp. AJS327]|uniref:MurR/RpiR family transcriptional regulator n=1 Tax=Streptomyces sp. AJS327 TaxID=2545265 RepID=UPI0021556288|nr:MurR/RpiR family transcriptional regulator [Streptomyces sp. AJS327]
MGGSPSTRLLRLCEGHRLTPAQRRIAHCLVRHAHEAAFLSSVELAELAGVSQPSVTRFAVALGFDGYPALRRELRAAAPGAEAPPDAGRPSRTGGAGRGADPRDGTGEGGGGTGPARPGGPRGSTGGVDGIAAEGHATGGAVNAYQQAIAAEIDNLRHLSSLLSDPAPVERAGRMLATSRPLLVLGLRAASPQARGFAYFAAKVHPEVRLLDEGGSMLGDRIDGAVRAGARTLLCFALPRHPRETVEALRLARTAGLAVVTVADSAFAPVAHPDDLLLPAAVGTGLAFDTACAPMLLGRALLESMCDNLPEAQARLEDFDTRATERGLFLE